MKPPAEIVAAFKGGDDFFIASHINPEADALGASLALAEALESTGKRCTVFNPSGVEDYYDFLPGIGRIKGSLDGTDTNSLTLVLLDCNTPQRAALEGAEFKGTVVIDHHATESDFGDVKWIVPSASATGLMVLHLIKEMGLAVSPSIATNLYAAIAVDTGTFRYSNTDPGTLRAAAELAEAGASPGGVAEGLYSSWSEKRFRLLCMTLNSLEKHGNIGITVVTQEMFRSTGTIATDTEEFASIPNTIGDIKVAIFMRELQKGGYKVSLRSKGDINMVPIAVSFGGGGHRNAAGCEIEGKLEDVKDRLLEEIEKII